MRSLHAAVGRAGKGVVVKFFEDFTVGEVEVFDATYVVTEEEIREVGERWDPQPFSALRRRSSPPSVAWSPPPCTSSPWRSV